MLPPGYEFQSELARESFAKGALASKASAVLAVLEARGLEVSADERERILACSELATLDGWVRKAATVSSTGELFG